MMKKIRIIVICVVSFFTVAMMARAAFLPQAKLINIEAVVGNFAKSEGVDREILPVIEILDQKISIDQPRYHYIKIRVLDDLGLREILLTSGGESLGATFFMEGFFYDSKPDVLKGDIWIVAQLPDNQTSVKIAATDFAGNIVEKVVSW